MQAATPIPAASPLLSAALLILHAVDTAGGQGGARDDEFLWERPIERRPLITFADIGRLRAAVSDEIGERLLKARAT